MIDRQNFFWMTISFHGLFISVNSWKLPPAKFVQEFATLQAQMAINIYLPDTLILYSKQLYGAYGHN